MVAAKCIPLGIGSDIGGSVRIPAAYCGLVSFKPSTRRVSPEGNINIGLELKGRPGPIAVTLGPLARSVGDVTLIMKSLWTETMFKGDSTIARMKFDQEMFQKVQEPNDKKIAYFDSLDLFPTSEAVRRSIKLAVDTLKDKGYTVEPLILTKEEQHELYSLFITYAVNYDFFYMMDEMDNQYERRHKMYDDVWLMRLKNWQKSTLSFLLGSFGLERFSYLVKNTRRLSE